MDERFLISKKKTGLGSDMATLVGAWRYARLTRRTLVIDWRSSLYFPDRKVNAFPHLFQRLQELEGVKVICDDSLRTRKFPQPVVKLHEMGGSEYDRLLTTGTDLAAPTLLCRRPMHIFPPVETQRKIFSLLKPHDPVQRAVKEFVRKEFAGATVVGVHFRHGNGEHLKFGRPPLNSDPCREIALACRQLYKQLSGNLKRRFRVFLATDSAEVEQELRPWLSSLFTWPKTFHKPGGGQLHRRELGLTSAEDALVEMFLLSYCNALVCNNSWFSYYARVNGRFDIAPVSLCPGYKYGAL